MICVLASPTHIVRIHPKCKSDRQAARGWLGLSCLLYIVVWNSHDVAPTLFNFSCHCIEPAVANRLLIARLRVLFFIFILPCSIPEPHKLIRYVSIAFECLHCRPIRDHS
ncbi:hypothetical protein LX36DRAFT_490420 [Colletotrichum falcatum]|nr:hypothetical protein LX36DRAFT_490420 [Colletotrichum falcatum]